MARTTTTNRKADTLVREAQEFINQHSGQRIQGCFHKVNGYLHTFGVYNTETKKHSIHHVTNFYPSDFLDIKRVVFERPNSK